MSRERRAIHLSIALSGAVENCLYVLVYGESFIHHHFMNLNKQTKMSTVIKLNQEKSQQHPFQSLSLERECGIFLKVIERFREVDAEMQIQAVAVLMKVGKHSVPIKMADIAEELGLSQSTISRNVAYLGDWNRHKAKGHGLLEAFEDPMERRRKLVRLTAKGKRFLKGIVDMWNSSYPTDYIEYIQEFVRGGGDLTEVAKLIEQEKE